MSMQGLSDQEAFRQVIRQEIARQGLGQGLDTIHFPKFLTTDSKLEGMFLQPLVDPQKAADDPDRFIRNAQTGRIEFWTPPEMQLLESVMILLNSHLTRTGNMSPKEARVCLLKLKRLFLMLEMEQDRYTYNVDLWALYEAMKLHLEGAVRDNIGGWRGKLLTVKEMFATVSNTGGTSAFSKLFRRGR